MRAYPLNKKILIVPATFCYNQLFFNWLCEIFQGEQLARAIAEDKALETQIMYKAGLSVTQINSYLKLMLETTLLEKGKYNDQKFFIKQQKKAKVFSNTAEKYQSCLEEKRKTTKSTVR